MNYWALMSLQGRYYIEADLNDRFFGFNDNQNIKLEYKQSGKDWIDSVIWLLQENIIWYE